MHLLHSYQKGHKAFRKIGCRKMKTIKITYDEFLQLKSLRYSRAALVAMICRKLKIDNSRIDDIDWNFGLTIYVWLKDDMNNL
jgi:hypothetical protein